MNFRYNNSDLFEVGIGISLDFEIFSFSSEFKFTDFEISAGTKNFKVNLQLGLKKIGFGWTYTNNGMNYSSQYYLKPIDLALVFVVVFGLSSLAIGAIGTVAAPAA